MSLPLGFDAAPVLTGPTLSLTPLRAKDVPALTAAAADPAIWAGHPARTRHLPEVFTPYAEKLLTWGGALVARQGARVVGTSRFYAAPDHDPSVSIGFTFLITDVWGGAVNAEMKALMLEHAFGTSDTVWLHIAPDNLRSKAASAKLGAIYRYEAELDHTGTPATSSCYEITRAAWRASPAAARARAAGVPVPA